MCKFIKAENAGNDYLYSFEKPWQKSTIVSLCSRRFGAGADGAVFIKKTDGAYFLTIFNADGNEADFCGNACITASKLLFDLDASKRLKFCIKTRAKRAESEICGKFVAIKTEGATPVLPDKNEKTLLKCLSRIKGVDYAGLFCAGNLHLVIKSCDLSRKFTDKAVKTINESGVFKDGVNVEFFRPSFSGINCGCRCGRRGFCNGGFCNNGGCNGGDCGCEGDKYGCARSAEITDGVDAVVFERGSGYTYACGSGALAIFACYNLVVRRVFGLKVKYKGGTLSVRKAENENCVKLIGTPHIVYRGEAVENFCGSRADFSSDKSLFSGGELCE